MNRRKMLERMALLMGGAVSASAIPGILEAFESPTTGAQVPQTLTPPQNELIATVAELIIPTTDTPGARAAGVNGFIDGVLTAIYTEAERARFLAGLADLESRAKARGASFLASSEAVQIQVLTELDAESIAAGASGATYRGFFHELKALTLIGYYRSEIGATQEQKWLPVPGYFKGDVPYTEVGRAWCSPWLRGVS